ncbi:MAG: hypothetical protein LBI02_09735 [Opitutaceae bacterium]|nr:hypothetical protein [Opitutaceae bacterium]
MTERRSRDTPSPAPRPGAPLTRASHAAHPSNRTEDAGDAPVHPAIASSNPTPHPACLAPPVFAAPESLLDADAAGFFSPAPPPPAAAPPPPLFSPEETDAAEAAPEAAPADSPFSGAPLLRL